jgi:ABC-type glycerol-3-phosphate transport system substrate-binding protein
VVVTVVVVVVMAVVVVMMAVMAVMAMTAAMTAVAAGRRVARGGEGRNRQHNGSSSGSEDRTLHWNFSWVDPERRSPWRMSQLVP